jgi:excisionase family DNA binding protein
MVFFMGGSIQERWLTSLAILFALLLGVGAIVYATAGSILQYVHPTMFVAVFIAATLDRERWLTPPAIARRLGVHPDKIVSWLKSGELRGVDVATRLGGRPRYRVDPDDLEDFLERRAVTPPPPKQRRRRRSQTDVIEFFGPDGQRTKV